MAGPATTSSFTLYLLSILIISSTIFLVFQVFLLLTAPHAIDRRHYQVLGGGGGGGGDDDSWRWKALGV